MNDHLAQSGSLIVTIDGPAGSGKTTVAHALADVDVCGVSPHGVRFHRWQQQRTQQ